MLPSAHNSGPGDPRKIRPAPRAVARRPQEEAAVPYRIKVAGAVGGRNFDPGDILDLPEEYARGWVEQGLAEATTDPPTIPMSESDLPLTFPQPQESAPVVVDESPPGAPEPAAEPVSAPTPPTSRSAKQEAVPAPDSAPEPA